MQDVRPNGQIENGAVQFVVFDVETRQFAEVVVIEAKPFLVFVFVPVQVTFRLMNQCELKNFATNARDGRRRTGPPIFVWRIQWHQYARTARRYQIHLRDRIDDIGQPRDQFSMVTVSEKNKKLKKIAKN